MKFVKRVIQVILILIVLVVASAFVAMTFYKKELTGMLISSLKTEYGLDARVGSIDISLFENWPHASIRLKDASVRSTLNTADTLPMFKAGSVSLSFEISRLLYRQFLVNSVSIEDAEITLVKDSADATNFKMMPQTDTPAKAGKISFDIRKVSLKNVMFRYQNKERKQEIAIMFRRNGIKLAKHSEGFSAGLTGNVFIDQLLFKPEKGPFLRHVDAELSLALDVFTRGGALLANNGSYAVIDGQRYYLGAFAELKDRKRLFLHVTSQQVDFNKGLALLNDHIRHSLSQVNMNSPVNIDAMIVAPIGRREDPQLVIKVSGGHSNIVIGNSKIPYRNISFSGYLVCTGDSGKPPEMRNAFIRFDRIKGQVYDFPFTASMEIRNLKEPVIGISANLLIEASKVKFRPGEDFMLGGNCTARIHYGGPLYGLNRNTFLNDPMRLTAMLHFNRFSYRENPGTLLYTVNGYAMIDNQDLKFSKLMVSTECGTLALSGISKGFTHYAFGNSNGFKTILKASTDLYDLNPMLNRNPEEIAAAEKKETPKAGKASSSNFAFDISLYAKKLLIRKIIATNVNASLSYNHSLLTVSGLNMNACNGALSARGTLDKLSDVKARVVISDMDVKMMMEEFENFGQEAIEAKNLQGLVSADADMHASLDGQLHVIPQSMAGDVEVKLKNGHLVNYEPMQRLSNFVFKNRDFDDITFTTIDQTFNIKGYEMQINNLEIASNVVNLYVDGKYNFKGESNINLRIPWSNLKKRGKDYIPKSLGNGEDLKGLKLNYHGYPNKLKLSLGNK